MTHDQTTPAPVEVTLKPCPFCGSADIRHDHPNRAPRVYCGECRVVADCPERWNTRRSAPDGEVEPVAWIPHDGGDCPVPPESPVIIKTRGGTVSRWENAKAVNWLNGTWIAEIGEPMPRDCEVVGYMPTHPAPPADLVELVEVFRGLIDDEPCRYDHHGYCQVHYVTSPCEMATARTALAKYLAKHGARDA